MFLLFSPSEAARLLQNIFGHLIGKWKKKKEKNEAIVCRGVASD